MLRDRGLRGGAFHTHGRRATQQRRATHSQSSNDTGGLGSCSPPFRDAMKLLSASRDVCSDRASAKPMSSHLRPSHVAFLGRRAVAGFSKQHAHNCAVS